VNKKKPSLIIQQDTFLFFYLLKVLFSLTNIYEEIYSNRSYL